MFPGLLPKKRWKVRSSSDPKKIYDVFLLDDDTFYCDCKASQFHRECRHKRRIRELINREQNNE